MKPVPFANVIINTRLNLTNGLTVVVNSQRSNPSYPMVLQVLDVPRGTHMCTMGVGAMTHTGGPLYFDINFDEYVQVMLLCSEGVGTSEFIDMLGKLLTR